MVEALPYLWIFIFSLMAYVAIYNLRHTKHGYRYPLWMILASSVVLSFATGSALQFFGLGFAVDDMLGKHMSLYLSQDKFEQRLWQEPSDGRLVGRLTNTTLAPTTTIVFEDIEGKRWTMNVTELSSPDLVALDAGKTVRVLGKTTNEEFHSFHACAAFPTVVGREVPIAERYEQRQNFVERVSRHARHGEGARLESAARSFASTTLPAQSVCATIAPVYRVAAGQPR
jgi:hypothetical protein